MYLLIVGTVQSQLKMDKDVPDDFRKKRVADVMQEVILHWFRYCILSSFSLIVN